MIDLVCMALIVAEIYCSNCCVVAASDITYKSKYAAAKYTQGTTFMPFATPKNLKYGWTKAKTERCIRHLKKKKHRRR
jgi:hypothetical protein